METPIHVYDFLPEFTQALEGQLMLDEKRWGDTFLHRTRTGQEERTIHNYNDKFDKFLHGGEPIPWLKIVGDAYICWVREQHPEIWPE
jgi:hypothetical protein